MNDTSKFWEDLKSGHFVSLVKESSRGQETDDADRNRHDQHQREAS